MLNQSLFIFRPAGFDFKTISAFLYNKQTEESVKRVRSSKRFRCGGLGIRFDSLAIKSNDNRVEKAAQFSVPRNV